MQASDLWTKLTAAGTLAASVIALSVATVPPLWRRYWRQPKLDVQVGEAEPWVRVTVLATNQDVRRAWFRIQVVNTGAPKRETSARSCMLGTNGRSRPHSGKA